jgi:dTMP kinase
MVKNKYPGKFIVFEGLDGSGKSTQLNLLVNHLAKKGFEIASFDFPQHGERSAALVDDYLNGKYGTAIEVGPWRASIFFACDRYDASFKIREWLTEGKIVVCDRYVGSNIGHQGGKIKNNNERKKYISWLLDLEYDIFGIPKPDLNCILRVTPEIAVELSDSRKIKSQQKLLRRQSYLGEKSKDMHESDINHQKNALDSYLWAAKTYPELFTVIECVEGEKLLLPGIIHDKIWQEVKKIL